MPNSQTCQLIKIAGTLILLDLAGKAYLEFDKSFGEEEAAAPPYDKLFALALQQCSSILLLHCALCRVVIAWTKFAKAESPTNILNFLDAVFPTPELCPNYICIDKAYLSLNCN
ncbi:hypothetical protein Hypma_010541 [Hypsizygus marmoreus]|uniref:Uncharacterized protein n=1 Tax=Hypsizygus marmoreus TaxID=39966 RepID=A0A369JP59_HYPMA|nr:hypothetical protein Hypma_010541 [Hypsizygus marmoreus]